MSKISQNRLMRELSNWDPSSGLEMVLPNESNMYLIHVSFTCTEGDFKGETHRLQFVIPERYPVEPPEVIFLTPVEHKHVYSNGHICLSILYVTQDLKTSWVPTLSIEKIALSIQSMLYSPNMRGRPFDDQKYIMMCARTGQRPSMTNFHFDDETC